MAEVLHARRLIAGGVAAVLIVAVVVAARHSTDSHNRIWVDYGIGEYFTPDPVAGYTAPVTADRAYARMNGHPAPIPTRVTARYGFLTMPIGPGGHGKLRYQYKDRAVWAFTMPGCLSTSLPVGSTRSADRHGPCLTWWFIDANTGQDLGGVG